MYVISKTTSTIMKALGHMYVKSVREDLFDGGTTFDITGNNIALSVTSAKSVALHSNVVFILKLFICGHITLRCKNYQRKLVFQTQINQSAENLVKQRRVTFVGFVEEPLPELAT
nr:uncharacterized protein LOC128706258 [Cherax quadricarinatus]